MARHLDKTGQTPLICRTGGTSYTATGIMLAEVQLDKIILEVLHMPRPIVITRRNVVGIAPQYIKLIVEYANKYCKDAFSNTVAAHLKKYHISEHTAQRLGRYIAHHRHEVLEYFNNKNDHLSSLKESTS